MELILEKRKKVIESVPKFILLGQSTYDRLIRILSLPRLDNTQYVVDEKKIIAIESTNDLGTDAKKYIFNNVNGEFFLGYTSDDVPMKLTTIIKKLWGITDNNTLAELNDVWVKHYSEINNILIEEELSSIYDSTHYDSGNISSSCMIGLGEYYTQLDSLPACKIAHMYNEEGHLIGRALVWDALRESDDEPIKIMDRIYSANSRVEQAFKKYAEKNGYYRRRDQNYTSPLWFISPDGVEEAIRVYVNFDYQDSDYMPFMDTFAYYYYDALHNAQPEDGYYTHLFHDTDGSMGLTCDVCGYASDDVEYVESIDEYLCPDCLGDNYVYDYYDTLISREDAVYVEDGDTYFHEDDDGLCYINGEYYHERFTEIRTCEVCYERNLDENMYTVYTYREGDTDYGDVCEDCFDDMKFNGDIIEIADVFYYSDAFIYDEVTDKYYLPEDYENLIEERKKLEDEETKDKEKEGKEND